MFWIELPLAASPMDTAQANVAFPTGVGLPAPARPARTGRTLLYIEDNLSNLRLIERLMQDFRR